ncbi:MAG: hypothetical protein ACE14V_04690 [bacterium]
MPNRRKRMPYLIIICGTIIIDWILGALCATKLLPIWIYLIANLPFGGLYVWMVSSWNGTNTVMLGHRIGDIEGLVIFGIAILSQSGFYCWLWHRYAK